MLADLVRFNREARALLGMNGADGPSLGALARASGATPRHVRRPADRAPGLRGLVRRSASRCGASRRASWSSSSTTTGCFGSATGRSGGRSPAARAATSRRSGALAAGSRLRHRRCERVDALRRPRGGDAAAGGEPSASTRSCSPPTPTRRWRCSPTPTDRERELLGAIPYQPNEAVLHTDARMLPRRRRAWASWNYPPARRADRPHDRHLPHEPPAVAGRRARVFCVTLDTHRRDRSRQGDPDDRLRPPRLHARGGRRAGALAEISGRHRTHYCGAYWGWGFHEDGVVSALRVASQISGEPMLPAVEPVPEAPRDARSTDPEQELAA